MSFYTALTGLNGSSADISATSNNIANVGTTGFKRSRAEFGDIFATSPLQNSSSSIGSGTILKGIKQQFTQGNIASSLNALDLAISGQGFLSLKPSLTSAQTVYTRNGSLNVNNDRYVVDSAGQYLLTYPVNEDGSVTAKDLVSAVPLQLPVTSGDPKATSNIKLGVNLPAAASVVTDQAIFADGYTFNPDNPDTFTNSTSITIFDDLGNPTIASIYFIKTQAADAADPTNKYDTRLVVGDTVIDPQLVSAVDDTGNQIFIDRFGKQTTTVPDDNYFIEGKGSALYKKDDLNTLVPSQRARVTGDQTAFDFGEEGDKLVEIVTDPLNFNSTVEGGASSTDKYWGKNFLTLNVDSADQPVNIDVRPGKYNATQLSAEVERAINEAYGDDRKIQIVRNVDDKVTIDLFKLNADGTTSSLDTGVISVDLLQDSFVTNTQVGDPAVPRVDLTGASPDFTREEFLAHTQSRINTALNEYAGQSVAKATSLGVTNKQFNRAVGNTMSSIYTKTEIVNFIHKDSTNTETAKFLAHSYFDSTPSLSVYDKKTDNLAANADGASVTGDATNSKSIVYDSKNNTMNIYLAGLNSSSPIFAANDKIRLAADWSPLAEAQTGNAYLNGREFTVSNVVYDAPGAGSTGYIQVDTTGLGLPDNDFSLATGSTAALGKLAILSSASTNVSAFFEGASNVFEGATTNFSSKKIVMKELDTTAGTGSFKTFATTFGAASVLTDLGLNNMEAAASNSTDWVDELNPPIKVSYDEINQRLQFTVDRTVLGTGTDSNFNSFTVTGNATATSTNNIGIPASDKAEQTLIRGGEILSTESFVADGEEIQLNDKRYGIKVDYSSDVKAFVISSGSTGETIPANGALGVSTAQKPSTIQVGRYALNASGEVNAANTSDYFASDNNLIGVGASKTDAIATDGTGLASSPAVAVGAAAKESLTDVFRLSSTANENLFNVSVNGINGVVTIPPGFYVGSTLAEALEERINQIMDPVTGDTVGGVRATYDATKNNFTFTTGTQGSDSTIKVKGTARLGLDDVPLGVGTVPEIYNLVQATNADGIALYVNENGDVVETPPANLVTGYYPLYIDEGELTFDKSGSLVSPINNVRYEKQEQGFSISLDMDYSSSTQFAQPFSVLSVDQDGFTSGRLDGLEIDSSGTIRANYTNGQNNPLGKIVLANFNNQNGLKQIGNATYVETAVSGSAQVGEAGAEGFGTVLSGSLERSNVDITEELVNLITAQRNFQASAKAIETFGSLTQTIIQIRQ